MRLLPLNQTVFATLCSLLRKDSLKPVDLSRQVENYYVFRTSHPEVLEPIHSAKDLRNLLGRILVRFPQLRGKGTNALDPSLHEFTGNCSDGTEQWLASLGALPNDIITLQDILISLADSTICYQWKLTLVAIFMVSKYANLAQDLSWLHVSQDRVDKYLSTLNKNKYSQPHFGKPRDCSHDNVAELSLQWKLGKEELLCRRQIVVVDEDYEDYNYNYNYDDEAVIEL